MKELSAGILPHSVNSAHQLTINTVEMPLPNLKRSTVVDPDMSVRKVYSVSLSHTGRKRLIPNPTTILGTDGVEIFTLLDKSSSGFLHNNHLDPAHDVLHCGAALWTRTRNLTIIDRVL